MREVISINIGQTGVQLGSICWQLYCIEHGIDSEGHVTDESLPGFGGDHFSKRDYCLQDGFSSFFYELEKGKFSPRTIFIDLEPTVIDELLRGPYRKFYSVSNTICGKEDAANNYARGYYSPCVEFMDLIIDPIRKMTENCDSLQGFMIYHSYGGGTGSGLHSRLLETLYGECGSKKNKLEIAIFPSMRLSTSIVEPYNAVLSTNSTIELSDCVFLADNEALYRICNAKLDLDSPNYHNINGILAQTVSSITASLRFKGTLNADFTGYQTNLVPFPRIHYPVVSYAPIIRRGSNHKSSSVADITRQCFDRNNTFVIYNSDSGKYVSICLLYRGDVAPKDINAAVYSIKEKRKLKFVDWSPTGFKLGINNSAPAVLPDDDCLAPSNAVCMLCNTTSVKELWANINKKFSLMARKKAFFHWFIKEGLNENEFYEAEENLLTLEEEYNIIEQQAY
ncbi:hypothetical protein O3M35_000921 [Rhynocoris fuscipes]|uniref:Tubulin alpha chain n=1 Tax=Rhynocoris fuscipes TaxID=488301 RepID=A0AAW1DNF3_9HEMI